MSWEMLWDTMLSFFVSWFYYPGLRWPQLLIALGLALAFGAAWLAAYRTGFHVGGGMDMKDITKLYRGRCGRGAPWGGDYFFRLHDLPPLVFGFGRASKGLSMVCR